MVKTTHFALLMLIALILFFVITARLPANQIGAPTEAFAARDTAIGESQFASTADRPASVQGNSSSTTSLAPGEHLPLMIRWSNWRPDFGPALVYAREQDLDGMLRMDGPVQKMLMVTSYAELERLMSRADQLHAAGVVIVGLNTENGPGMTPPDEMRTLDNPDPNVNFVARAARLATERGFRVIWGPVRNMADSVSDATLRTVMTAGVSGVALQEQKFIEHQPAQARLSEVNRTRDRYLRIAREQGINDFSIHVQIMQQRCPDLANCVSFVQMLEAIPVSSIAIWSNGPIPPEFVSAIRQN